MPTKKLTLKIFFFLFLSDLLETFIQFCFKKTVLPYSFLKISDLHSALIFFKAVFFSPYLWLAFLSVFMAFVLWSTIISKIDLSVAVPISSSSYILVPLTSIFFLHESVSILRWSGILFIIVGVILVSLTTKETAKT
jgi:drug/metabolite transporter (DMT)-like permease